MKAISTESSASGRVFSIPEPDVPELVGLVASGRLVHSCGFRHLHSEACFQINKRTACTNGWLVARVDDDNAPAAHGRVKLTGTSWPVEV